MVNEFIEQYNGLLKTAQITKIKTKEQMSKVDRQIADLLHVLELEKIDAVTMMRVCKRLKELQQQRRQIKYEMAELDTVISCMHKPLKAQRTIVLNREKYNTDIVKEFIK